MELPYINSKISRSVLRLGVFMILGFCLSLDPFGMAYGSQGLQALKPAIYVNVETSTWKTRGRLLYDIEGTILKKLSMAGFQPVRDSKIPHEFELSVRYQEKRGEQYRIEAWGTVIRCQFRFSGVSLNRAVSWEIVEYSENSVSGSPPYLDAVVNFETSPLYYFLGELLMFHVEKSGQIHEGLKSVLEERVSKAYSFPVSVSDRATAQDHFMDSSNVVYQDMAFQRAIDKLRGDHFPERELLPIAQKVSHSPARSLRLRAVQLLGSVGDPGACYRLKVLAGEDPDKEVRHQAKQFVEDCRGGDP